MTDNPENGNNEVSKEISVEELIQGVGRLVMKLNDSVDNLGSRLETMETAMSSMLDQSFKAVTSELSKTNQLLSESAKQDEQAPGAGLEDILKKMEEVSSHLTGIREGIDKSGDRMVEVISQGFDKFVEKDLFTEKLDDVTKRLDGVTEKLDDSSGKIIETSESLGAKISEIVEKASQERIQVLSSGMEKLTVDLEDISGKMEGAREKVEAKLEEIKTDTAQQVSQISEKVAESSQEQQGALNEMKELLSLHSVEVKDNRVRELNRSAIVHFNNSEYDLARQELNEALDLSPESPELLANLAHIEASLGNLQLAEKHFREALRTDPDLEPAISGLGTVMVMSGRPGDTIEFLQKYLEDGSDSSTSILIALSRAHASQGNHDKALSILERAEKAAPGHPELEQELAKYRS